MEGWRQGRQYWRWRLHHCATEIERQPKDKDDDKDKDCDKDKAICIDAGASIIARQRLNYGEGCFLHAIDHCHMKPTIVKWEYLIKRSQFYQVKKYDFEPYVLWNRSNSFKKLFKFLLYWDNFSFWKTIICFGETWTSDHFISQSKMWNIWSINFLRNINI